MKLIFKHPDMPPSLNGTNGLLRMHWSKRKKTKEKFQWLIKEQKFLKINGCVTVSIINYAIILMDWDNLAGRFKIVGDSLVSSNLLKDDSPKVIIDFKMKQIRVNKRDDVKLVILIEPID